MHLLLERLSVVLGGFRADVAPGREHVAVFADVVELCGLAEPRNILLCGRGRPHSQGVAAPGVVGAGDILNDFFCL